MKTRPILSVLTAGVFVLAACGSDDDSGGSAGATNNAPAASEAPAATDAPAPTDSSGSAGGDYGGALPEATSPEGTEATATADTDSTVMVANDATLGDHLVDGNGRTLYLFTRDEGTTTACTDSCADNWPPMVAETPVAGDGADAGLLATADGIEPNQVTYNGHLLYFFAGDAAPGDTNGHGLPDWYLVSPAGEEIE